VRIQSAIAFAALASGLICSGQTKPPVSTPESPSTIGRELPGHIQLVEPFVRLNPPGATPKVGPNVVIVKRIPENEGCAHIIVKRVTPEVDPKISRSSPKGVGSRMPVIKGLPPCPSDLP